MAEEEVGPEAVKPLDSEKWHLVHVARQRTLCGEPVLYGSRWRLWAATPHGDRCDLCLRHLDVGPA